MKGVIRVGCVDQNRSVRTAISRALAGERDISLNGSWGDAETAMPSVLKDEIDLLLLSMELPGMSGAECLGHLRRLQSKLKVIMTTDAAKNHDGLEIVRSGAFGLLIKPVDDDCLIGSIRSAHRGRTVFCAKARHQVLDACLGLEPCSQLSAGNDLSRRERQVLQLLREGYTDQQIADLLGIKLDTEKEYLKSAYKKLGVHSRVQAVRRIGELE